MDRRHSTALVMDLADHRDLDTQELGPQTQRSGQLLRERERTARRDVVEHRKRPHLAFDLERSLLLMSDIEHETVEIARPAIAWRNNRTVLRHPVHLPIGAQHAVLHLPAPSLLDGMLDQLGYPGDILRMHAAAQGPPPGNEEIRRRIADDMLIPAAHEMCCPVLVVKATKDRAREVLDQCT